MNDRPPTSTNPPTIPPHVTRQRFQERAKECHNGPPTTEDQNSPQNPSDPFPLPASVLTPDQRREVWSRTRTISRNLAAIREILDRSPEPLTQDDQNALAAIQAVYARMSFVQSMYARKPDVRRNRFLGR